MYYINCIKCGTVTPILNKGDKEICSICEGKIPNKEFPTAYEENKIRVEDGNYIE